MQPAETAEGLETAGRARRGGDHGAALEQQRAPPQVDPAAGARGVQPPQQLDEGRLREVPDQVRQAGVGRGADLAAEQHQQQSAGDLRWLDSAHGEEGDFLWKGRLFGGIGAEHHQRAGRGAAEQRRGIDPRGQRLGSGHDHGRVQTLGETPRLGGIRHRYHFVSFGGETGAEVPQALGLGIDQQHGGAGEHGRSI